MQRPTASAAEPFTVQRPPIHSTHFYRAQTLFSYDDIKKTKPRLAYYLKYAWIRRANFGALLLGLIVVTFFSGMFASTGAGDATAPTSIQPLSCGDFLRQVHRGSYRFPINVHDPNHKKEGYRVTVKDPNEKKGHFKRLTTTEFPFTISLHHEKYDRRRWKIYLHGEYYQRDRANILTDILREASPGARVIDIGGLIGYYALLSASMGEFNIDVFEPSLMNNIRTCESLRMNKWPNEFEQQASAVPRKIGSPVVNVWNAGISDIAGKFKFFESYGNPGGGRFGGFGNNRTDYAELPVTTLDTFAEERSWFESLPEIAILQIDVEQDNSNVLVGAQKLLKSGLVQNIFTEVSLKDPTMMSKEMAAHELLVQAGYKLKGQGGWAGPGKDSPWPDDANLVKNIFHYLEEEHKETLTLWWSL